MKKILSLFGSVVVAIIAIGLYIIAGEPSDEYENEAAVASYEETEESGDGEPETAGREALSNDAAADDGETESDGEQAQAAADGASAVCGSHEREVEPGICSYIVDCDNPRDCAAWADRMVRDLTERYGDLTYAQEWDTEEEAEEEAVIATYPVKGNAILNVNENDETELYYKSLWERFAWVIPSDRRDMVSHFAVFDNGDLLAYVIQSDEDYEQWTYAAHIEQAEYETERVLTDIHEFGHLLALNSRQIDPYADEEDCGTHYYEEGCAREGAYMYEFQKAFWDDGDTDDEDNFVSEYAMTDVYEDFAESWSHFVVTERPEGDSVVERKIAFFYNYDELVMLRAELLGRMASWLERNVEEE